MLEHIGLKTATRLVIALGTTALILAPGTATGAVTENVDETISIPGSTPSGFIEVNGQKVGVPGAENVTVRIQATGSLGDPVLLKSSGGAGCTRIDRQLQVQLAGEGTGSVTVSYTEVDGVTGVKSDRSHVEPFPAQAHDSGPVTIGLCFR